MKKHKTILLPLGRQFSIILVLFIVCTAGITLYNTQDYVRVQTDFLSSSLDSYSSQLAKNTLEAYDSYKNICYSVAYSSVVQDFLSSKNRQSSYEAYQELRTQLENTFLLNPYISDIAVYGQDGTFASLGGSAFSYKPFADKLEETSFPYCTVGTSLINGTNCHILAMPICTLGTGQSQRLGILFLAIDINHLLSNSMTNMNSQKLYEPEILFANAQQELIYGTRSLYRTVLSTPAPQSEADTYEVKANSSPVTYIAKCYSFRKLGLSLYVLVDKRSANQPDPNYFPASVSRYRCYTSAGFPLCNLPLQAIFGFAETADRFYEKYFRRKQKSNQKRCPDSSGLNWVY